GARPGIATGGVPALTRRRSSADRPAGAVGSPGPLEPCRVIRDDDEPEVPRRRAGPHEAPARPEPARAAADSVRGDGGKRTIKKVVARGGARARVPCEGDARA